MRIPQIKDMIGVKLDTSAYEMVAGYARDANNVITQSGAILLRPSRVELASRQLGSFITLGMIDYSPVGATANSLILVNEDGIYIREGV